MANTGNISVAPQLAAIAAQNTALAVQNTAIDAVVDAIRATDIITITDAITAKLVRGLYTCTYHVSVAGAYEDAVNITGSGKIVRIIMSNVQAGDTQLLKITPDGVASSSLTLAGVGPVFIIPKSEYSQVQRWASQATPYEMNFEFSTSLVIEHYRSVGAGAANVLVVLAVD